MRGLRLVENKPKCKQKQTKSKVSVRIPCFLYWGGTGGYICSVNVIYRRGRTEVRGIREVAPLRKNRRCRGFVHWSFFIFHSSFLNALSVTASRATSPGGRGLDFTRAYAKEIAFVGVDLPDDPKTKANGSIENKKPPLCKGRWICRRQRRRDCEERGRGNGLFWCWGRRRNAGRPGGRPLQSVATLLTGTPVPTMTGGKLTGPLGYAFANPSLRSLRDRRSLRRG